jgi:hypothetical protein
MNVFVFLIWCVVLSGVSAVWAAKAPEKPKASALDAAQDESAFLKEIDSIRDPFVSPLANNKKPDVKPPTPAPVEPPRPVVPVVRPPEPPRPAPIVLPPPVVEPAVSPFSAAGLKINGIVWNTDLPQAIVNDRVVRIGEDLQGAKIVAIKKEGIEVVHNGTKHILRITDDGKDEAQNQSFAVRRSQ